MWRATDAPQLSKRARSLFANPDNELYLSAVSAWEIAVGQSLGKVRIRMDPSRLVPEHRKAHRIVSLPLDEEAALLVSRLPSLHRDPFDRMLICQALEAGLTILTPDELIRQYAVPTTW